MPGAPGGRAAMPVPGAAAGGGLRPPDAPGIAGGGFEIGSGTPSATPGDSIATVDCSPIAGSDGGESPGLAFPAIFDR